MATAPTTDDASETASDVDETEADDTGTSTSRTRRRLWPDWDLRRKLARGSEGRFWPDWDLRRKLARGSGGRFWPDWSLRRRRAPARATRPRRRIRLIDVLRVLGLARRAVPHPVVGPKAYVQWWQRVLALLMLIVLVGIIGFVLAAAVGIMVVVAGFLLEQAIS